MYILLDEMMLFCWYVLGPNTGGKTVTDDSEPKPKPEPEPGKL